MADEINELLYQSIEDLRSTIRAVDIKAGFLFVIVFQPLLHLATIASKFKVLCAGSTGWQIIIGAFVLFWCLSLFFLLRSVLSISNPSDQIVGNTPQDIFFDGELYNLTFTDAFINRSGRGRLSFEERVSQVESGRENIFQNLVFEKMKLAYIRDIKMKRINSCIWCLLCWLIWGMGISIYCILFFEGGN